jgi:hypothetical protein
MAAEGKPRAVPKLADFFRFGPMRRMQVRGNFHDFQSIWTAYHFNFAGIDRNLSKSSFTRWVVRGAPRAASAFNVVAMA